MSKSKKEKKIEINKDEAQKLIREAIEDSRLGSPCKSVEGEGCAIQTVISDEKYHNELGLEKEVLKRALKYMLLGRLTDEKHLMLVRQGKSFFHIGGSGHEAVQVAVAMNLEAGKDWAWPYYRDCAFVYTLGMTAKEYFLAAFAKPDDPATGGRQMPGHYGSKRLNIPTQSSPTGTQFLNAVGTALGTQKLGRDEVVYVSSGEGTTSQGEFYEAVNWASREKLPVLFCIQDNGYAISVPREHQAMGSTVGHSFCCYSNLKMITFDGTDFFGSYIAGKKAVEHIRSGKGPVLLHALVERLLPHSSSDDQRKYRPADELQRAEMERDCIKRFKNYLLKNNILLEEEIVELEKEVKKEIDESADWAYEQPDAKPEDATKHIFSTREDIKLNYSGKEPTEGNKVVMVDAINHALFEEMEANPKMLIFGEDIADPKGGVFTATRGLTNRFGSERVFNSPLAEASIIGVAIGLAIRGFKPVVEIQFGDYIWPAFMQLKNELATLRYRSNGNFSCPVVVRVAVGGYIHGGLYHSQNIESIFSHIPGIYIAYPSTAADAKGLLKTACRLDDPVIFCEHKGMYRLPFSTSFEPDSEYFIPFGKGKVVKDGSSAVIVTYGMGVKDSINAVKRLEKEKNVSVEIIDLRTIIPWDRELVFQEVRKSGRVLIVHEDTLTTGFGAELSASIVSNCFEYLDAPIMRVTAKDSHIPYNPIYENEVLPNEEKIYLNLQKLLEY